MGEVEGFNYMKTAVHVYEKIKGELRGSAVKGRFSQENYEVEL